MDKSALAAEIAELMGWDPDDTEKEVEREIRHPGIHVKESWVKENPQSPAEIERFYLESTAYIYDLVVEGVREIHKRRRTSVLKALEKFLGTTRAVRLLDYGGGAGNDCLYFSRRCARVDYFDLPGVTSTFARDRFGHQKAPVNIVFDVGRNVDCYDALISFEVLEYVTDPLRHLDEMVRSVRPGGMLFLTEAFDLVNDEYHTHLPRNVRYAGKLPELLEERGCRLTDVLHDRVHVFVKCVPVTIIVPVYNAFEHTVRLLESVKQTDPGHPCTWLLINDGSSDPRIGELLVQFGDNFQGRCQVIDRDVNLGFVKTCNEGMTTAGRADVILLNSDTIVYDGWVASLVKTAYSESRIGTVTPLSNNASAFSVLRTLEPNNDMNRALSDLNLDPIDIPTGVGFCLYIKRGVIDKIGLFDPIFGIGYGEETDFCQRATAIGYRNVLARNCFIYHAGQASMVAAGHIAEGATLIPEHEAIIEARHPKYPQVVREFLSSGVIDSLDAFISKRYVRCISEARPSIAFVVHTNIYRDVIGGTEDHVRDLIRALREHFVFYVLFPEGPNVRVVADVDGITSEVAWKHSSYIGLLDELRPSVVHIHHLMGFHPLFVDALCHWDGPKLFTIHDYHSVCKQYTLLDYQGSYCDVPDLAQCDVCAKHLFQSSVATPLHQRLIHQKLIDSVDAVISPSRSALDVVRKALDVPQDKAMVIPHPYSVQTPDARTISSQDADEPDGCLSVGFLGYDAPQKGAALAAGIVIALSSSEKFRFVMIGSIGESLRDTGNVVRIGSYKRKDVVDIIRRSEVDVVVLPSPWPETYSYTLTEAWAAGVPVVVGPLGAPAERVNTHGGGVVVADYSTEAFTNILWQLADSGALLAKLKKEAATVQVASSFQEYFSLYSNMIKKSPEGVRLFSGAIESGTPGTGYSMGADWLDIAPPYVQRIWRLRHRLFPAGTRRGGLYVRLRARFARWLR